MDCTNKLKIVYGDATFGVHGEGFDYIFSYHARRTGISCERWKRMAVPLTATDILRANFKRIMRGNGFSVKSGMWLSADLFQKCVGIRITVDGGSIENFLPPQNNGYSNDEYGKEAEISYTYETITVPATKVDVTYHVTADGKTM